MGGPNNWREGLRLDLWCYELSWEQWLKLTTRAERKRVYRSYINQWFQPNGAATVELVPGIREAFERGDRM